MNIKNIILLIIFLIAGCSKRTTYEILEIREMILKHEPKAIDMILDTEEKRVACSSYGDNCIANSGKRFSIRGIELISIAFKDQESAFREAKSIGQYYARNWVFDDVAGEPILINFVKEVFNARTPLKNESEHPKEHKFIDSNF